MRYSWHRRAGSSRERACAVLLAIVVTLLHVGTAATTERVVGVVDFYAPTPLAVIDGVIPERTAADDLSAMLARRGHGMTVVPRATVLKAEGTMGWREEDALSFDRLVQLGGILGADRLIVGWITTWSVGGETTTPDGDGMPFAQASVLVQIFDPGERRLLAERTYSGSSVGMMPGSLTQIVLHNVLAPVVPWLLTQLEPTVVPRAPDSAPAGAGQNRPLIVSELIHSATGATVACYRAWRERTQLNATI